MSTHMAAAVQIGVLEPIKECFNDHIPHTCLQKQRIGACLSCWLHGDCAKVTHSYSLSLNHTHSCLKPPALDWPTLLLAHVEGGGKVSGWLGGVSQSSTCCWLLGKHNTQSVARRVVCHMYRILEPVACGLQ